MNRDNNYLVKSIDICALNKLLSQKYQVHSIFKNVVNLSFENHIITIVNNSLCMGPNRILLNDNLDFSNLGLKIGSKVIVLNKSIILENMILHYEDNNLWIYQDIDLVKTDLEKVKIVVDEMYDIIDKLNCINAFNYHRYILSSSERYQFEKINTFLSLPNLSNMKGIVGLGYGLTPLGDDVLVGYMLARNCLKKDLDFNLQVLDTALKQTNIISYNILKDTCNQLYSDDFKTLVWDTFVNYELKSYRKIMNYGVSSGIGILSGFICGIKKVV